MWCDTAMWPVCGINCANARQRKARAPLRYDGTSRVFARLMRSTSLRSGSLRSVILNARGAQTGETMLVDGPLPAQKLIYRKRIAFACLIQAQQTPTHSGDDLGLAADNPAFSVCGWKIGNRQRTAVWPNNIAYARPVMFCHVTLTSDPTCQGVYAVSFKNCLRSRVNAALGNWARIRAGVAEKIPYPQWFAG